MEAVGHMGAYAGMMAGLASEYSEPKTINVDATYLKAHWRLRAC